MSAVRRRLRRFVGELRRRKVLRVLAAYVIVAWIVIQVVETTWEALHLPDGTLTVVIVVLAAMLPLVLILAWQFDIVADHDTARRWSRRAGGTETAEAEPPAGPPSVLHGPGGASGNPVSGMSIPDPGTPLFGREEERSELRRLLLVDGCRLVTIAGPGGVGKTRLALHAALEHGGEFAHGAAFVPLSGLPSPDLLAAAIAEALGVSQSRRGDLLEQVIDFLRAKRLLLVLDNFEHLLEASQVVVSMLDGAPGVHLLVTSRERLNLRQETVLTLAGLPLAEHGRDDDAALRLFEAAARRADASFRLTPDAQPHVRRICTLTSGVPLAIELAASWVRVLSCGEIVLELERSLDFLSSTAADVPQRHRSLRATFDASWRLLSDAERRAMMCLSVFRASFDRAAARDVADADVTLLRSLVDKSLLTPAGGRFLVLDVIRQYAGERLAEHTDTEAVTRRRHLRHFIGLLAADRDGLRRSDPESVARVTTVIDDVRTAWRAAAAQPDSEALAAALDALFSFYEAKGWAREGADSLAPAAQSLPSTAAAAALRARLDVRRGVFCDRLGEHDHAERLLRVGLEGARAAAEPAEIAFTLNKLGANRFAMGDYDGADRAHAEARQLAVQSGNAAEAAWAETHLGNVAWARGAYDQATTLYDSALRAHRAGGDRTGLWIVLNNLGVIAGMQQHYDEARRRFADALAVQVEIGNRRSAALLHHNIGYNSWIAGDLDAARHHIEEASRLAEEMGYRALLAQSLAVLADLDLHDGRTAAADATAQRALRTAAAARSYPVMLQCLLVVARLRAAEGDAAAAARIARVVHEHPASERDERENARALLHEIGDDAASADNEPNTAEARLEPLVRSIIAEQDQTAAGASQH